MQPLLLLERLDSVTLEEASAGNMYITHTGACGVCSSLQDLAAFLDYSRLVTASSTCFLDWVSSGKGSISPAVECYMDMGFSENCAETLILYQKEIDARDCGTNCAAFALDGDQGQPSCEDTSGCASCGSQVRARFALVAGRTFANSGYPSGTAVSCGAISTSVLDQGDGDICAIADGLTLPNFGSTDPPVVETPTAAPIVAVVPTSTPVAVATPQMNRCRDLASVEERMGQSAGANVTCICTASEMEGSTDVIPTCYSGDVSVPENQCKVQFGLCTATSDCCSAGVRTCRMGQCRSASRAFDRTNLRLGSNSANRGDRVNVGGAGATTTSTTTTTTTTP
jgi:hypothetical protein